MPTGPYNSIPVCTYGRDHGETVNGRVDEAPRAAAAVRGRAGLERVVQLFLELDQLPAGRHFPLVLAEPPAVGPQPVEEVALHPLHAALVERLERALGVTEHDATHAAHDHQYHLKGITVVINNAVRRPECADGHRTTPCRRVFVHETGRSVSQSRKRRHRHCVTTRIGRLEATLSGDLSRGRCA